MLPSFVLRNWPMGVSPRNALRVFSLMVSPFIEFGGLRGFADIQRQAKLSQGAENGGEFGIGDSGVFKFDQPAT